MKTTRFLAALTCAAMLGTMTAFPVMADDEAAAIKEVESNDTLETADVLPLHTPFTGNLYDAEDMDYFMFTLPVHCVVELNFAIDVPVTNSTGCKYWSVDLCTSEGDTVRVFDIDGTKANYHLTTQGLDTGSYYLRVRSNDSCYCVVPYTLTVNAYNGTGWEGESNNSLSTADEMAVNSVMNARMYNGDDIDYYKLTVDSSGKLTVKFEIEPIPANDNEYWQLSLLNEKGEQLLTKAVYGNNTVTALDEYEAEAGTYYILVNNDSYYHWTTKYMLFAEFEQQAALPGDVNGNEAVDASDAAIILIAAAKLGSSSASGLTEAQEAAADVNGNGTIDAMDAAEVLSYAAAAGAARSPRWHSRLMVF